MRSAVTAHELLTAADKVTITFDSIPKTAVAIPDASDIGYPELTEIVRRYEHHGFAIFELAANRPGPDQLTKSADSLGLGVPFVPPLNAIGKSRPEPVSRISAALNADTADASHPSFGRTDGQELHSDGTLQDIGFVKATILLCESAAAEGGDTRLFNSSAACADVIRQDLAAATALATPGTLVRQANINGCTDANAGPVFAVRDDGLDCRYSVTSTDGWAVPDGVDKADLRRGIDLLAASAQAGSPHYVELTLSAGQGIVFNNARISHGRTPYRDSHDKRRCMYRGLYLSHPCVGASRPVASSASA